MVFWIGPGKARTDTDGKSILFFADKKVLVGIDHAAKTYSEIPMDFDKMFEEAAEGETEEEKAEAKKMAQMMKAKSETWASQDLKVDFNAYFTMANAMMANMPGFEKLVQEMKKVKGVVVHQTTTSKVMGQDMTSTMELLEYAEKSAPAGTYDSPAGYKKVKGDRGR